MVAVASCAGDASVGRVGARIHLPRALPTCNPFPSFPPKRGACEMCGVGGVSRIAFLWRGSGRGASRAAVTGLRKRLARRSQGGRSRRTTARSDDAGAVNRLHGDDTDSEGSWHHEQGWSKTTVDIRVQATSRCECQATLTAVLDDKRHVLHGYATRLGAQENAPAHSIGAERESFDLAWMCPFCGRNTLRTFYAGALRPLPPAPTAAADEPALPAPAPTATRSRRQVALIRRRRRRGGARPGGASRRRAPRHRRGRAASAPA